jgi:Flp pilus assembly protein TadB
MNIQLETFNTLLNSQTGLTKTVAKKILNRDFVEALNKIMNSSGAEDKNDGIKKLIEIAVRKVTDGIRRKIAVTFTIILSLFAVIAAVITLVLNGNIIIPLVIFAVIIALIWIVTGNIFKHFAQKMSAAIFKAVESKISGN